MVILKRNTLDHQKLKLKEFQKGSLMVIGDNDARIINQEPRKLYIDNLRGTFLCHSYHIDDTQYTLHIETKNALAKEEKQQHIQQFDSKFLLELKNKI